jgi:hypothetical protein
MRWVRVAYQLRADARREVAEAERVQLLDTAGTANQQRRARWESGIHWKIMPKYCISAGTLHKAIRVQYLGGGHVDPAPWLQCCNSDLEAPVVGARVRLGHVRAQCVVRGCDGQRRVVQEGRGFGHRWYDAM